MEMIATEGLERFSLRALAKRLGVDPSALYRHYADLDDLLREVGDLSLAPVTKRIPVSDDPRADVRRLLIKLRQTLLASGVAMLTAAGPTRHNNELAITEFLLEAFDRIGLVPRDAVVAYHAFIEYTVGSAALDAPLAGSKDDRAKVYKRWRDDYLALDAEQYPAIRKHASLLYPSNDRIFEIGLDALIERLLG